VPKVILIIGGVVFATTLKALAINTRLGENAIATLMVMLFSVCINYIGNAVVGRKCGIPLGVGLQICRFC